MGLEKVLPLIRKEIEASEVARKISELDSKLVELKKAVEGIVIELTYIKSELKELRENSKERKFAQTQPKEKIVEKFTEKNLKAEEIKDVAKKVESEKKVKIEEEDLIICD